MWITQAWAQDGAAAGAGGMGQLLASLGPIVLIFAVMWFFLIRPQQRKMRDHRALVAALKKGDRILTNGGIIGVVTREADANEVEIEIATGVKVRVLRQAISDVLNKPATAAPAAAKKEDEKAS